MLNIVHAKRWQAAAWAKAATRCDAVTQTPPLVFTNGRQFPGDGAAAAVDLSCAPANASAGLAVGAAVRGARVRKAQRQKLSEGRVKGGTHIAWRRAPLRDLRPANNNGADADVVVTGQSDRSSDRTHARSHRLSQLQPRTSSQRQHTLAIVDL